jgi:hypothetical protein
MSFRSSAYVKANDARYGLKVASRDPKTSKVLGFQCRLYIAFGREEKVGSKRKPTTTVQRWLTPFPYDNIENHMHTQHPTEWAQYVAIKSDNERDQFSSTFLLLSRIPSKHISRHHWVLSARSFLILI